jgi:hypothetical protein
MTCRIPVFIPASLIHPRLAPRGPTLKPGVLYTGRGLVNVGLSGGNINPRSKFFGRDDNELRHPRGDAVVKRALTAAR